MKLKYVVFGFSLTVLLFFTAFAVKVNATEPPSSQDSPSKKIYCFQPFFAETQHWITKGPTGKIYVYIDAGTGSAIIHTQKQFHSIFHEMSKAVAKTSGLPLSNYEENYSANNRAIYFDSIREYKGVPKICALGTIGEQPTKIGSEWFMDFQPSEFYTESEAASK